LLSTVAIPSDNSRSAASEISSTLAIDATNDRLIAESLLAVEEEEEEEEEEDDDDDVPGTLPALVFLFFFIFSLKGATGGPL
jgi:hypothetical protein